MWETQVSKRRRHQSTSYHSCHSCHSSPRSLTCSLCPGCPCKHLQCTCKASRFEVSRIRVSKNGKHETNISNMYFIELHCTSTQGSVDVGCAVGNVTGRRIVVCGPVLIVAGSEARSQSLPRSAVTDVTCCLESAGPHKMPKQARHTASLQVPVFGSHTPAQKESKGCKGTNFCDIETLSLTNTLLLPVKSGLDHSTSLGPADIN